MAKPGFTLLETLIYIALFGMIGLLCSRFIVAHYLSVSNSQKKSAAILAVYSAISRLRADIQMADPQTLLWQESGQNLMFGGPPGERVCWSLQKGNLYRMQAHTKALVAQGVDELDFRVVRQDGLIKQVVCGITCGGISMTHTMRPYNGPI